MSAHDAKRADCRLTAHERHESRRPIAASQEILSADRHFRRRILDIGNIEHLPVENGDAVHVFAREREGKALPPQFGADGIAFGDGRRLDHAVLD